MKMPKTLREIIEHDLALRGLCPFLPIVVVRMSDGVILFASDTTERLFGYDEEELTGKCVEVLIPIHLRDNHERLRLQYAAHPVCRPAGAVGPVPAIRKDGSTFPVEVILLPIKNKDGVEDRVGCVIADLTARIVSETKPVSEKEG